MDASASQTGLSPTAEPVPVSSADAASIPSAFQRQADEFLAECEAKRIKFSEINPALWRDLARRATPPTLTVCKHLESEEADRACRCQYPGSVWADGEHILFTMGDQWGNEEDMRAGRIDRSAEIASAQLLTCLFNNADWLIDLAASAMSAGTAETAQQAQGQSPASATGAAGDAQPHPGASS